MKHTKTIETFLNKEMTESERNNFLLEMKLKPELAMDVALYEEVNEAIADDQIHEFRKSVKEIIVTNREKSAAQIKLTWHFIKYPLAASICILIGFSLWQIFSYIPAEKIATNYYKPYDADIITRSESTNIDKSLLAIQLYQRGEYESSFEILTNYLSKNYGDQTARFFYGMNSIELGKYELAIEELRQVEQDASSEYALHARWYLSLTLLKLNMEAEAVTYLKSISKNENYYSDRAAAILKKIKT